MSPFLAVLFSILTPTPLFASDCVTQVGEISGQSSVKESLMRFGGLEGLVGNYKMKGLLGALSRTEVSFKLDGATFWVSINKDKYKQVHLCDSSDHLKVKILSPKKPENGTILIKPGAEPESLLVSAHRSGWKYMKFRKLLDMPKKVAKAN